MNRNNLYIIVFLCSLLLASCTNEEYAEKKEQVVEGLPATVSLALNAIQMDKIQTRAGEALANDGKVFDLMLFQIKGEDVKCVYFEKGLGNEGASTSISFSTESVNEVQLYALANVEGSSYKLNKESGSYTVEDLKAITDKNTLMSLTATLDGERISYNDGYVLMSGYLAVSGRDNAATINIAPGKNAITSQKIYLKRVCSAITFDIKAGPGVTFTPKTWQIKSLPYTTNLFEKEKDADTDYFSMTKAENVSNGKFTFYMSENRKNSSDKNNYDNRPTFAPKNSSYLVLTGEYEGPAGINSSGENVSTEKVHADVTYYIYLGYINEDVNNFVTERNKKYEYTITVKSVDKIIQEVVKKDYNYPTGDGDVYYTGGSGHQMVKLDAHNCSFDIIVDRNDLKKGIDYGFAYKTPKTGYQWVESKTISASDSKDYNWVRFVKKDNLDAYVAYPGDDASKDMTIDKFVTDVQAAVSSTEGSNFFDEKGRAYFTVFVLEYYYGDAYWKVGINGQNREMKIIMKTQQGNGSSVTDAKYYFSQKPIQSIYDVDNVDFAWGIEWVNESGDKDGRLKYYETSGNMFSFKSRPGGNGTSSYDGRANMIKEMGKQSVETKKLLWYNNKENPSNLNSEFLDYAYAACMSRNRDEDGDGLISGDEIKWYLPASNQYNDIWMGIEGIDHEAWLYPYFGLKFEKYHYFTNTDKFNNFWAEEGASLGAFGNGNQVPDGKNHIRCARNLGKTFGSLEQKNGGKPTTPDIPDVITSQLSSDGKYRLIELSRVNKGSVRVAKQVKNEMAKHYETSDNNKPYSAYVVKIEPVAYGREFSALNKNADNNISPCSSLGKGWRLPTHREYTMFASRYDSETKCLTRTYFSFGTQGEKGDQTGENKVGFVFNGHMGLCKTNADNKGSVRCVRDIDQDEYTKFGFK